MNIYIRQIAAALCFVMFGTAGTNVVRSKQGCEASSDSATA